MEWVEAQGRTVEDATAAALAELQIGSRDDVTIEVLQEPKAGFLGMGGQDAVVKVTPKPRQRSQRRRRRPRRSGNRNQREQGKSRGGRQNESKKQHQSSRSDSGGSKQSKNKGRSQKAESKRKPESSKTSGNNGGSQPAKSAPKENAVEEASERSVTVEEQAEVAAEFLDGLLGAFGLEGEVVTRAEDDILYIDISGDQTEALVGPKGSIMQSVLELTRTVIQRKTFGAPRMRIDIAGYTERRREALKIYTGKLVEKVVAEQSEVMLEPMNPADRKVVHDAVAEHEGVRSFSEGEDPHRSVVIAVDES
jgi:spoIIIJ-associated protein